MTSVYFLVINKQINHLPGFVLVFTEVLNVATPLRLLHATNLRRLNGVQLINEIGEFDRSYVAWYSVVGQPQKRLHCLSHERFQYPSAVRLSRRPISASSTSCDCRRCMVNLNSPPCGCMTVWSRTSAVNFAPFNSASSIATTLARFEKR